MIRILSAIVLIFVVALSVSAQTVVGDRFRLNTGPCTLLSGSGSPEGAVIGKICDHYIDVVSGTWWEKWQGTATNTGWGVGHNANATINGTLLVSGATSLSSTLAVTSNTNLSGYVGVPGFVSQLTGWRIDNLGGADFRSVYADEGHYKVFIADLEQALAGGQIIAHSVAILANAFTCPALSGATTLTVEDLPGAPAMQVFESGDAVVVKIMSRSAGSLNYSDCIGGVTSPVTPGGTQSWTFTRYPSPNGGSTGTGGVTPAKGLAIDYGTSGSGYHEVNAIDGVYGINSPYSQIVTWTTAPTAANRVLRTRLGNLRGITGVTGEYGAILGTYGATGSEQYLRASSTAFETHNLNISMYSGATEVIKLDRTAPSLAIGSAVPTAYGTGTGIWTGIDGGVAKLRAGVPGGAGLFWDGTTLTIRGTAGSATNMIRNSECRVGTEDWAVSYTSASSPTLLRNLASFRLNDVPGTCYLRDLTTTPANGTAWFMTITESSIAFPVKEGSRYEASVYLGLQSLAQGYQQIVWFNNVAGVISTSAGNVCTPANGIGGLYLTNYCRSGVVATAPAGAVRASSQIVGAHDGTGATIYFFAVRPFFGEATATQTLLSEWGPAGTTEITGGVIRTETIIADHLAANTITAAKIAAGTITATEIAAATITGAKIAAGTIAASNIVSGTITAAQIAGGTITADKLNVTTLSAVSADLGTVTGGSINIGSGSFTVSASGIMSATTPVFSGTVIANGTIQAQSGGDVIAGGAVVSVGRFETQTLIGTGTRDVCADSNGILVICP